MWRGRQRRIGQGAAAWVLNAGLAAASVVALCSCRADPPAYPRSDRLDGYLHGVPVQLIDLDAVAVDTLRAIATVGEDSGNAGLFAGQATSSAVFRDSLLVADMALDALLVADAAGTLARTIGRAGEGPGEFKDPVDVVANDSYFFVHDVAGRVQGFDAAGNSATIADRTSLGGNVAVNEMLLFVPSTGADSLIDLYLSTPPFTKRGSILPRLIGPGFQPGGHNAFRVASGLPDGSTVVAYGGMPFLIRLDEQLMPVQVIQFEGKAASELSNPPPVETADFEPVRIRIFVRGLDVIGHCVALFQGMRAYLLGTDGTEIALRSAVVFTDQHGKPFSVNDLTLTEDKIIVASTMYASLSVFELPLAYSQCFEPE